MRKKAAFNEEKYVLDLITRIVHEAPRRQPTSPDELKASQIVEEEFRKLSLQIREHKFRFNDNLYANLALHFGLGSSATMISGILPALAMAIHASVGLSYLLESTRKAYLLRKIFPFKQSRNIMGILPAKGPAVLRIVVLAHVDAAFTGLMFKESVVKLMNSADSQSMAFLHRGLALATWTQLSLAGFDALRILFGPLTLPLRPLEYFLNLPALITFALNLDLLARNKIVPGANDDLSGVAALPVLAERFAGKKPENVEIIFTATGCEEASLGGCDSLVRDMEGTWSRKDTVFVALDCLTNGKLYYLHPEGEVVPTPVPSWLRDTISRLGEKDGIEKVEPFQPPVGGSDIAAVLARGYDGVCLTCVQEDLGSPRYYHLPTDSPENLDMNRLMQSIDFAERLIEGIIDYRLEGNKS
ncbi:MAG: Zn-dependent exopeptidase M28 [Deltaproteobacteria bacterium]|nr:Zn-dependent exopeptidase M28 [Deltaproteobacteria bacterium]